MLAWVGQYQNVSLIFENCSLNIIAPFWTLFEAKVLLPDALPAANSLTALVIDHIDEHSESMSPTSLGDYTRS